MTSAKTIASSSKGNAGLERCEDSSVEFLEGGGGAGPPRSRDEIGGRAADILESITDGFCAFDSEWRYTYFNAAAERMMGSPRHEMLGRNHWELFPAARGTIIEREYLRAVRERVPVEFEVWYEPLQRSYAVRAYPTPDGGLSVYFRNITQRKEMEKQLRKASIRLEAALSAARSGRDGSDRGYVCGNVYRADSS